MKNPRILGLLALLMLFGMVAHAQNDIVRLRDGSFIRGTIIEYIVDDHVKIKTEEGKIYEFPASEMLRAESNSKSVPNTFTINTKGYYNITSVALMFGSREWGGMALHAGIYTVNGWQWNERWMTGLGLGMEYMEQGGKYPITADLRYNILKGKVTPYAGLSVGYTAASRGRSVDWWGGPTVLRNYGGITAGGSFGIRAYSGPHVALTANFGYRFQKLKVKYNETFWNGFETVNHEVMSKSYLNRFVLGFGLLFN